VIYYGILCLCKIVEYFTLIRKYVLKDALVHLEYGRVLNEGVTSIEELLANEQNQELSSTDLTTDQDYIARRETFIKEKLLPYR
jgi:hypothetical protein